MQIPLNCHPLPPSSLSPSLKCFSHRPFQGFSPLLNISFRASHHHFSVNLTMNTLTTCLLIFFLSTASLSFATRPEPTGSSQAQPKPSKDKTHKSNNHNKNKGGENNGGAGGFFGPGGGFNVPGFGYIGGGSGSGDGNGNGNGIVGGGYGYGIGGPKSGSAKGGVIRSSVVCKDKGPCYKTKLTCPAKCFTSYSRSGKGYGGGGGGGGCTMDCKKCVAFC